MALDPKNCDNASRAGIAEGGTLSLELKVPESRGRLVRRLDLLLHQLKKEKGNYCKPKWLINTGDLERLRNEARYCFIDF